jgi:hypothetical protein
MVGMSKREKTPVAKQQSRPVLPAKLQRSLEQRRAASDQRVAKPGPRTVPQHQGPRHQSRGG